MKHVNQESGMVYRGTYKQGVIVLDEHADLTEGQRVFIEAATTAQSEQAIDVSAQNRELLKLAGIVNTGRRDGSVNHDHYMYGSPKRKESE